MRRMKEPITEYIKTVAVLLLMVMLICLCVIYMLSYQGVGQYAFTKDTMQTLGSESVKYQYADYFKSSYVSPKTILFSAKSQGEDIGFYTLGGEHAQIYASLLPFYEKLFSEQGEMTPLSSEDGEMLFETLRAGDYIYLAYETDLPKTLLYALSTENAMAPVGSEEYIREIMIVPDEYLYDAISLVPMGMQVYTSVHTFYAVARDSLGNYYCYTTDFVPSLPSDVSFNTNYYLTYTTVESYFACEPAANFDSDAYFDRCGFADKITDTTVIIKDVGDVLPKSAVSVSPYYPETDEMNALLGALLINPDQVTSFTDGSGVRFYYDEGRNASISPSGLLEYSAHGAEGLPLSDLFEYPSANEIFDVRDYVGASLLLARSLENAAGLGGEYSLFLSGLCFDGDTITVTIGYAVDGLPLYFGGSSEILRFEFENGMLKRVVYDLKCIAVSQETDVSIDMVWSLRAAIAESNVKKEYAYGYCFRLDHERVTAELVGRKP